MSMQGGMGDFDLRGLLSEAMARAGRGARELPGNAWRGTRAVLDAPPQELLPMLNPVPVDAIQGMASGHGNAGDVLQLIAALGLPAAGKLGKLARGARKTPALRMAEEGIERAEGAPKPMGIGLHVGTGKPGSPPKTFPVDDIRGATKYGERMGQRHGVNAETGESFPIGNLQEFLSSPEFRDRMTEMQGVGREYLDQHPNPNWWDIRGTALERVYGPEQLQRVAGLTAATAPTLAPSPNLQLMSEYMRRHLKGEDLVQPDYRNPAGLMSRTEGKMLGNEASRANNLGRADRLEPLGGAKVESERRALLGDPNAVVLDRHWAKIAEKPESGVFVEPGVGTISNPKTYEMMASSVSEAAKAAGLSPRDFSANVWTGIRETIRTKNELFGQKFKKGSIQGESKAYADVFEDLLDQKAAHLGITKPELEAKLRSGDANLLAWVVAGTGLQQLLSQDE